MIGQAGCVAQEVSVASSVGECKWTIALQEPSRRAAKTVVSCEAIQVTRQSLIVTPQFLI